MENTKNLRELLEEWDFLDYIDTFIKYGLDEDTIWHLTDNQLEKIFEQNMGNVIKFKLCLSKKSKTKNNRNNDSYEELLSEMQKRDDTIISKLNQLEQKICSPEKKLSPIEKWLCTVDNNESERESSANRKRTYSSFSDVSCLNLDVSL